MALMRLPTPRETHPKGQSMSTYTPPPMDGQPSSFPPAAQPDPMPAAPAPAAAYPPAGQLNPYETAPQPAAYPPATFQTPGTPMQYPSYVAQAAPQKNMLLYVVSIIMIVVAGIAFLAVFVAAAALAAYGGAGGAAVAVVLMIVLIISVGLFLAAGILGVRNCADPSKGQMLFYIGIAMIGIGVLTLILSIVGHTVSLSSFTGFVIPGLYTWGAYQLKSQA